MPAARLVAVDRVKACAIIAVAVTHAGPPRWSPLWTPSDDLLRVSWTAFHVPAFLLVAGWLYRTAQPMPWTEVARRIDRVARPYLVVMAVFYATGRAPWPGWTRLPFALLTGESYGIFYFVPVLMLCIGFGWLLSRCSQTQIVGLTVVLLAYALAMGALVTPPRWPSFWGIRDPFSRFYLGFFACGWLGLHARLPGPRWGYAFVAVAIIALWVIWGFPPPWPLAAMPLRILYALAVVAWLWTATWTLLGMRFLSEASLGLYLLHRPIMDLVAPVLDPQPALLHIPAFVVVGLGGATAVCLLARATLGHAAARRWLGA